MNNNRGGELMLPLNVIEIMPGFNPRKFFDANKHQELITSILQQGVIQPIVVRPKAVESGYWLVCGERRYRAAIAAGLSEIPAIIRVVDDADAKIIAIIENAHRDDMSPAEEAESARDVLTDCNNDRDEAAKKLGWSKAKFDSRMLLLHASAKVLAALTERKIKLGHAELLSQLTHEFQDNTLAKIIADGYSVADLKAKLGMFALNLSDAVFDKADCQNCPHNSSMHYALFDDHINDGQCANHDCFKTKTTAAMEAKKATLSEQYAVVFLDTERTPGSFVINCKSGKNGVGNAQFEQGCRQCAKFGALLNTAPDRLGEVTEDCCFDTECHKGKVADYQKSLVPQAAMSSDKDAKSPTSGSDGKSKSAVTAKTASKDKTPAAATLPAAVSGLIETFFRSTASTIAVDDDHVALCLDCFCMFNLVGIAIDKTSLPIQGLDRSFDRFMRTVLPLPVETVRKLKRDLQSCLLKDHESSSQLTRTWANGSATIVNHLGVPLGQHFLLTKEFLGAFTKSGIESVLREAVNCAGQSFLDFYESQSDKHSLSALMKKKNVEILEEVFSCGYDFSGFVPACVLGFMGEAKVKPLAVETAHTIETAIQPVNALNDKVESNADDIDCESDDDLETATSNYVDDELDERPVNMAANNQTGGKIYDNYF